MVSRMPPSYDSWVNAQVDLMKPVWLTLIPNVFIKSHTHPNDNAHPVPAKHYAYIYIYIFRYLYINLLSRKIYSLHRFWRNFLVHIIY